MIRGSCLCRGVAWEIKGPLELMTHCHCSMCRKAHGSAYATYVAGPAGGFRWVVGEELVKRYESSPGALRPFCSRCGSVVPGEPHDGRVFMPAGNLDDDPGARPMAHIFVDSKAPWNEITDNVPSFEGYPPGWPAPDVDRPAPALASREGALRGSCLCGGIVFEVSGDFQGIVKCHCSRCRKARSATHANNLFIQRPDFRWLQGEELIERYKVADAKRFTNAFCRVCGSIVPPGDLGQDPMGIPAGSLDSDPRVGERVHIFTGSKAPWYEITDDLPQFEGAPGPSVVRTLNR